MINPEIAPAVPDKPTTVDVPTAPKMSEIEVM